MGITLNLILSLSKDVPVRAPDLSILRQAQDEAEDGAGEPNRKDRGHAALSDKMTKGQNFAILVAREAHAISKPPEAIHKTLELLT